MRRLILWALAWALVLVAARAETSTISYGGSTSTVTASFDPATGFVSWSRLGTATASSGTIDHYYAANWMYKVASNGSTVSQGVVFDVGYAGSSGSASGTITNTTHGSWYLLATRIHYRHNGYADNNSVVAGPVYKWIYVDKKQVVNANPLPADADGCNAKVGDQFTFQLTGSKGGNDYEYRAVSGYTNAGVSNWNPDLGILTYTASGAGEFWVEARVLGTAGGWEASDWKQFKATLCLKKQEVTITGPAEITVGEPTQFQATGAQGGNSYNFSVVSGSANIIGDSQTGYFAITATGKGPIEIAVWASAGNGYSRSDDEYHSTLAIGTGKHKVTLTLDNRGSAAPATFKLYQGGSVVGTQVVAADSVLVKTFEVPDAGKVTVTKTVHGSPDGPVWINDGETEVVVGEADTTEVEDGEPNPSASPPTTGGPDGPQTDEGKSVWSSVTPANKDDGLTAKTYAEGVDKLKGELKAIKSALNPVLTQPGDPTTTVNSQTVDGGALTEKLPEVPQISIGAPVTSIAVAFEVPSSGSPIPINLQFDAAPYDTVVSVFRFIFRSAMAFGFFLLYVSTIRKAFAN